MTASFPLCPRTLLLISAVALLVGVGAAAQYPAPSMPVAPENAPEFPASFAPFSIPGDGELPAENAPALAEWNRTASPGDTLTLTGSGLSTLSGADGGSDTGFVVYGQAGRKQVTADGAVRRLTGNQVAITLPAALPTPSLYLVWPRNAAGLGRSALLNATEAWWVGPDLATRGQRFAVYGRNLTPGRERRSWAYLQDAAGAGRWLKSHAANAYRADFFLPEDAVNGEYRVWLHNGLGGALGWSGPLKLTVGDGMLWTGRRFNVRDFGAKGDGVADDLAAIRAALGAAGAAPSSTVYFPPGHYAISDTISVVPSGVQWRGAGRTATRILPHASFPAASYGLVLAAFHDVEIRDLTFSTAGRLGAAGGSNLLLQIRGSERVSFVSVGFDQEKDFTTADGAPIDLHLCRHVALRGCDFRSSGGVFLGTSRQVFFESCKFRGLNDLEAFVYVWGGSQVSITGCSAADFDSSDTRDGHGWAEGRFLSGFGTWGASREFYFGQNRTTNLTVRPTHSEQNTGEQFLFEGMETLIRGTPDFAGPQWVQFVALTDDYTGQILVVIAGAGLGQSRQITAFDPLTGTLTVDAPWTTPPDATSTIVVGHYMSRMAVYGNSLSAKPRAASSATHVASAGVEPFGGCVQLIVAGNTMKRLRYGISNWSMTNGFGDREVLQPNFFNEFLDNRFIGCRQGVVNLLKRWQPGRPQIDDTGMLGNLFRGNRFSGLREPAFVYQISAGTPAVEMMNFDRNTGDRSPFVTSDNAAGARDQILTGNRFRGSPLQP